MRDTGHGDCGVASRQRGTRKIQPHRQRDARAPAQLKAIRAVAAGLPILVPAITERMLLRMRSRPARAGRVTRDGIPQQGPVRKFLPPDRVVIAAPPSDQVEFFHGSSTLGVQDLVPTCAKPIRPKIKLPGSP